jgi:hypothetical protein
VICDFDDFHESNHKLERLYQLRDLNPRFKVTMFAVPAHGTDSFWECLPDWIELAQHGWHHGGAACPDPREAEAWSYEQAMGYLLKAPATFVPGFKAPGWQISDGTYQALLELGWWVADQGYNDWRRPEGLRVHLLDDGNHWHGHVQDVCGNGIEETWPRLQAAVAQAADFQFVSEVVRPWAPVVAVA